MKVAIIHYWFANFAGGERVVESLCRLYPQADIYTHILCDSCLTPTLERHRIKTTFIDSLPFSHRHYQKYLPLMPLALEQLDLRDYDVVISSESGPAKGVLTRADTAHVCYCHSPMRYLWDFYQDYLSTAGRLIRPAMRLLFHRLRMWDAVSSMRVDAFAANSSTVARRIKKHWRRDATIIHPPVSLNPAIGQNLALCDKPDTAACAPAVPEALRPPEGEFYLYAGRLAAYKRADVAVQACTRANKQLIVIGSGEEEQRLRAMAGPTVHFLGRQPDAVLAAHYAACSALLFPAEEDFGMVPVEAQLCGAPVIAYGVGGALDTVLPGISGIFFNRQSPESLLEALEAFPALRFDPARIRQHAARFGEERFQRELSALVDATLNDIRA